ncbi:MAG TPA: hypothetical protein PK324_21880, partial [Nocardioides sp.]|nr:hypothetical protein [Nocardioides sp.]
MATDLRLAYADIDEELFDVDQIPVTSRDVRSVGEMLFDVDYLARQLLMDVGGDDAGTLLRSWPTMVAAAEDLWASLPGRRPGADERDRPITRLSAQASTIESSLSGRKAWPGQGPTNPRVDQMTQTLLTAAALVRRYGAEIPHEQPDAHRDLEAARTRLMHGLYLTAHAVNVALHDKGRDRVNDARGQGRLVQLAQHHSPYAIAPMGVWVDRVSACESTARSYLTDRFAQALAGEAIRTVDDPGRLAQAMATWDIQSHRALARDLEPSNILLITRTQGLVAGASMVLVDAATTAGDATFELNAQLFQANLLVPRGEWQRAEQTVWQTLQHGYPDASERALLGFLLAATGRTEQAIGVWDEIVSAELWRGRTNVAQVQTWRAIGAWAIGTA